LTVSTAGPGFLCGIDGGGPESEVGCRHNGHSLLGTT